MAEFPLEQLFVTLCYPFYQSVEFNAFMRISLNIVNWEMFCWPANIALRMRIWVIATQVCPCGLLELLCRSFACCLPPPARLLVSWSSCVHVSFFLGFYSPLKDQCERCQGKVTRGRLPWLPPLFAFCPHLFACCLHCSLLAPTLHLNIAYRQVNE